MRGQSEAVDKALGNTSKACERRLKGATNFLQYPRRKTPWLKHPKGTRVEKALLEWSVRLFFGDPSVDRRQI